MCFSQNGDFFFNYVVLWEYLVTKLSILNVDRIYITHVLIWWTTKFILKRNFKNFFFGVEGYKRGFLRNSCPFFPTLEIVNEHKIIMQSVVTTNDHISTFDWSFITLFVCFRTTLTKQQCHAQIKRGYKIIFLFRASWWSD